MQFWQKEEGIGCWKKEGQSKTGESPEGRRTSWQGYEDQGIYSCPESSRQGDFQVDMVKMNL